LNHLTSEFARPSHPDKLADQVSDAILDAHLFVDPLARVADECLLKGNTCTLAGEITSRAVVDLPDVEFSVLGANQSFKPHLTIEDQHLMPTIIQTIPGGYINAAAIVSVTNSDDEDVLTATLTNGEIHEISKADITLLARNYVYLPLAEPMPAMMVSLDTTDGSDNPAAWACHAYLGSVVGWRVSTVFELGFIVEEVTPVFAPGTYLNETRFAIGVQNRDGTVMEHGGWRTDQHFSDFEAFKCCAEDRFKRLATERGAEV